MNQDLIDTICYLRSSASANRERASRLPKDMALADLGTLAQLLRDDAAMADNLAARLERFTFLDPINLTLD